VAADTCRPQPPESVIEASLRSRGQRPGEVHCYSDLSVSRRTKHGKPRAVFLLYLEAALTATVVLGLALEALYTLRYGTRPLRIWYLPLFGLSVLGLTGTLRGWPWPLRLLLHAGWLFSAVILTVEGISHQDW
jgi:hypothetical protein